MMKKSNMKQHIKKLIFPIFILLCCYCVVDAVIETQQKVFPVKADEIRMLSIGVPDQDGSIDDVYIYNDTYTNNTVQPDIIADKINALPMYVDEYAKNEIISDLKVSPYEKPVVIQMEIRYSKDFLQRKYGTRLFLYEDGTFMVKETWYPKPLLIRFFNQWNYDNWDNFKIYAVDDRNVYNEFLAELETSRAAAEQKKTD